jgi:hypothetical protein
MEVAMRRASTADGRFIADSWLRSYQPSRRCKGIPSDIYWANHRRVVSGLLDRADTWVACDPTDPWTIWGWICGAWEGQALVLHYVYVKDAFRGVPGLALGTRLIQQYLTPGKDLTDPDSSVLVWTHETGAVPPLLAHLTHKGILHEEVPAFYNPYPADKAGALTP